MTEQLPWSDPAADPLADIQDVARPAHSLPVTCGHCGRTSHGFVCCGQLAAEAGEVCTWDHGADVTPKPAPNRGQSGPPQPLRPPRRIDPRGSR